MTIQVDVNPPCADYRQLRAQLALSGWGSEDSYPDAILEKMIKGCSYFVVAHETNNLLGYARAFTDDIAVTWIAEILVHPGRRRQGIGANIMKELLRVTGHTAIYAEAFVETEGFLEVFGITKKSKLVACSRKPFTT
ncbi:MAG: GNAT family N-acetyltransferase [Nitrospira sp.]|nr:GNAT family N-acetyltransferase [Nitrospira sp.]